MLPPLLKIHCTLFPTSNLQAAPAVADLYGALAQTVKGAVGKQVEYRQGFLCRHECCSFSMLSCMATRGKP